MNVKSNMLSDDHPFGNEQSGGSLENQKRIWSSQTTLCNNKLVKMNFPSTENLPQPASFHQLFQTICKPKTRPVAILELHITPIWDHSSTLSRINKLMVVGDWHRNVSLPHSFLESFQPERLRESLRKISDTKSLDEEYKENLEVILFLSLHSE